MLPVLTSQPAGQPSGGAGLGPFRDSGEAVPTDVRQVLAEERDLAPLPASSQKAGLELVVPK